MVCMCMRLFHYSVTVHRLLGAVSKLYNAQWGGGEVEVPLYSVILGGGGWIMRYITQGDYE